MKYVLPPSAGSGGGGLSLSAAGPNSDAARPFTTAYQQHSYSRAGNYYAHNLREIHDDSRSVFPDSVYSEAVSRRNRWRTIYTGDYLPLQEERYDQYIADNYPELSTRSAQDLHYRKWMGKERTDIDQMFMKWKVPERLTTPRSTMTSAARDVNDPLQDLDIPAPTDLQVQETVVPQVTAKCHASGHSLRVANRETSPPRSPYKPSSPKAPSLARMSFNGFGDGGLSYRPSGSSRAPRSLINAPNSHRAPRSVVNTPRAGSPRRHTGFQGNTNRTFRTQQLLKEFVNRPEEIAAEEYWKTAGELEKRMVAKTLRLMDMDSNGDLEAIRSVQEWLEGATEEEREAALQFFQVVADAKIERVDVPEDQKERINQIVSMLRNYDSSHLQLTGKAQAGNTREFTDVTKELNRLRHLRLLTPQTRNNKWLHKSWHHMPPIKDRNPVNNPSAVYSEAGVIQHRHWNIHPDWKLQL